MGRGDRDAGKINGLIDKGCSMEGRLTFDGAVQINGDFRGDIISDGTLIVGPEAAVEGNIQVGSVIIEGNVQGVIEAKGKIELRKGCRLVANISTPSLSIEEGAVFHGQCNMLSGKDAGRGADQFIVEHDQGSIEDTDSLMM